MPTQTRLLPDSWPDRSTQRTIHYLGSKLRLLEPIRRAISALAPVGEPVCDLFAGSGVVSLALASDWNVTSVDIQEYSRVLCDGLVQPPQDADTLTSSLCDGAHSGRLRSLLRHALTDVLEVERRAMSDVARGTVDGLGDLLEHGSLLALEERADMPPWLRDKMSTALERLKAEDLDQGPETVITRHFGGRYFSWEQAIDLDALLDQIHRLSEPYRDFHLAVALIVASDVVNTVGKHFAQPIKLRAGSGFTKRHLVKQTMRDRRMSVFERYLRSSQSAAGLRRTPGFHRAVRSHYVDFLEEDTTRFAAFYADPPYTRDHYSRYYHVLETMALRDDPEVSTTKIRSGGSPRLSRGLYRLQRHQSPFCIPNKAPRAFDDLFLRIAARRIPLVLSYSPYQPTARSRPRLLTIDELLESARRHFRQVDVTPVSGVSHNKFNIKKRNVRVDAHAEVLVTCSG